MATKLQGHPSEFECLVSEVPVNTMFVHHASTEIGIKTSYKERNDDQKDECVCVYSPNPAHVGHPFLAGTTSFGERDALSVEPLVLAWVNV